MKIKRFKAKTFAEALALVKQEMGSDAVILSSEEQKGITSYVEVTAAADYDINKHSNLNLSQGSMLMPKNSDNAKDLSNQDEYNGFAELKREIEMLKETIEGIKNKGMETSLSGKKARLFDYLRKKAIKQDLALSLCETGGDIEDLIGIISKDVNIYGELNSKKAIIVIGPTGVGKTTTIAKLSALAIKKGKKVALINLDVYRIGAIEQIRIYSKMLGVSLDIASNAEELRKGLLRHLDKDIVFIDTTGKNPKDNMYIEELRHVYKLGFPIETHLLISANSDEDFMFEAYKNYERLPIDCLSFTKVDEAVRLGSIYNLLNLCKKPAAYITVGQRVPQDIAFPNSESLARLILQRGGAEC